MAKQTDIRLRGDVIYSVYVRNHTPEGTFNALISDLDRIKALGTDIIWLMPIHPIGVAEEGKSGLPVCQPGLPHGQPGVRHHGRLQASCG